MRGVLRELGVVARTALPERLGDAAGAFARLPGMRPAPLPYVGPAPAVDEFVLLCGLTDAQVNEFLARSREAGCVVAHKALLTKTNRALAARASDGGRGGRARPDGRGWGRLLKTADLAEIRPAGRVNNWAFFSPHPQKSRLGRRFSAKSAFLRRSRRVPVMLRFDYTRRVETPSEKSCERSARLLRWTRPRTCWPAPSGAWARTVP